MKNYEKPIILMNEELAEGVYAASGDEASAGTDTSSTTKCESQYMLGNFQAAAYDGSTYKQNYGCMGCVAFRSNGCGIQADYSESNIGHYKPTWEQKGYQPDAAVTDWGC